MKSDFEFFEQPVLDMNLHNFIATHNYFEVAYLLPSIEKIDRIRNNDHDVVILHFKDGASTKAICESKENYSFEVGIVICLMKKMLGNYVDMTHVNSVFNRLVNKVVKQYEDQEKDKKKAEFAKVKEQLQKENKKKKKLKKLQKRAEKRKQEMIEIQTEAYFRAMKKLQEEQNG